MASRRRRSGLTDFFQRMRHSFWHLQRRHSHTVASGSQAVYPDCSIIREDNPTPPSRDELADIQSLFTARIKHVNVLGRETEPDGISDFQWQAIIQNEYDLR